VRVITNVTGVPPDISYQAESLRMEASVCEMPTVGQSSPSAHPLSERNPAGKRTAERQLPPGHDFLMGAPEYHAATRQMFEKASGLADEVDRGQGIVEVHRRVHGFATTASVAGLAITARVASALAALLKKLCENPRTITPSTINTITEALICLERMCVPGIEQQLAAQTPVQILVVEDEPLAKRAVMGSLERAFDKPQAASNGSTALALISEKTYDVIFTDVQMPVMDGFELCMHIRESSPNARTPVIFITGLNDVASRSRGKQCGGNDFIKKPFLPIEMTVKALTFAWEVRLRQIDASTSFDAAVAV